MKSVLVFLALMITALVAPLVLAAALSAIVGIGPVEMMIIYALCIAGALLTWRSFRRTKAALTL